MEKFAGYYNDVCSTDRCSEKPEEKIPSRYADMIYNAMGYLCCQASDVLSIVHKRMLELGVSIDVELEQQQDKSNREGIFPLISGQIDDITLVLRTIVRYIDRL